MDQHPGYRVYVTDLAALWSPSYKIVVCDPSLSLSHSQDGPGEGTVTRDPTGDGWVRIQWDSGETNSYRMGEDNRYDLALAPSELEPRTKEGEKIDEPEDADISVGECWTEDGCLSVHDLLICEL